jgi:hypothetical protein
MMSIRANFLDRANHRCGSTPLPFFVAVLFWLILLTLIGCGRAKIDSPPGVADSGSGVAGPAWIDCQTLPPVPATSSTEARRWFSLPGVFGLGGGAPEGRIRVRGQTAYIAAGPRPIRIEWSERTQPSLCRLAQDAATQDTAQDVVAPSDSSAVVFLFGSGRPRRLLVSTDDGQTWAEAKAPGEPSFSRSVPAALASIPASAAHPARLFATYGGPTLDVSEDGGLNWTRISVSGMAVAQGFAVDTAHETLWYVDEASLDRVVASWLPVGGPGPLPATWKHQLIGSWDANGVYAAEADPADPHAIYLGGEGRLGYLRPTSAGVEIDLPWSEPPFGSGHYVYVTAIWPDPDLNGRVLFGGSARGESGASLASLMEIRDRGREPVQVAIEGEPNGGVCSIATAPDPSLLLVTLQYYDDDGSLGVFVLGR